MKIAEVFLNQKNKRIDHSYDYEIPKELEAVIKVGMRTVVTFGIGNRQVEGFVVLIKETTTFSGKIKKIIENIDIAPVLNKEQIELCLWMKTAYCSLFYEALSYFTSSVKIKLEICYTKKGGNFALDLRETWFIEHYFTTENEVVLLKKIKPEDQTILAELVNKKVISLEKKWVPTVGRSSKAVTPDLIYSLTEEGRKALIKKDKSIGKNQRMMMDCLLHKDMTTADLKMISKQFEKSLKPLIEKNYIQKNSALKIDQKAELPIKEILPQAVVLNAKEEKYYHDYTKLIQNKIAVFFHVFDGVSKYKIFFKAIAEQLKVGNSTVVIFPEINMTFQRMEVFYKYFGDRVGIFHSRLTAKQKADLFYKVQDGELQVVIGVRSAIFLPFKKLGLIIIDDEHDTSHVSISTPKFHISDVAKKASKIMGAALIIADDSPRITTWYQIEKKELNKLQIGENKGLQKKIQIVDMQKEMHRGNMGLLSQRLLTEMRTAFDQKRLSVLFVNNTGYANSVFCRNCGHLEKCPNCGIAMKYFNHDRSLHCRYCGYKTPVPQQCPVCKSDKIRLMGFGIDQLLEYLKKIFPDKRIITVQGNMNRTEINKINKDLTRSEIDILIGTQVIIKHFNLTNVGVAAAVLIDRDLNQGNYYASETVYQTYRRFFEKAMDDQTIGLIQTHEPENETIYSIINDSFQEFYRDEIQYRKLMNYPPVITMISFGIFQKNEKAAENDAFHLYVELKKELKASEVSYAIFKPVRMGVSAGGNITYQVILKLSEQSVFQNLMPKIIKLGIIEKLKSKVSIEIN
ncbi:replication restart helicase PriA [Acetobacterium woodii]|uniref:Probable replication restart protein PriA n=1 Tax=Acetobacterium woodii (strain ATCC 29683 / DSM 1030 / JCM 2381 / KCTC 1655 / WB1) TaxID=931626 RepID=H6LBI3_ACEWD|nr:primosomal protein N' [Acetobacterium woodii]AFA48938.1 primosomal protein N PriA [Acetobacterium woodii DSM 1030]